jgi:hypothetical protein
MGFAFCFNPRVLELTKLARRVIYKPSQERHPIVESNLWEEAMTEVRTADAHVAFRTAWQLEKAYKIERTPIVERFEQFLSDWLVTNNESVKRIYTKMLYDMLLWERVAIDNLQAEKIAERAFTALIDNCPVGTKMWLIELLTLISKQIDWIEETLTPIVRQFSEDPAATHAIQSITRRYLKSR